MIGLERPRRPCEAMQIMSHLRFFPGSDEPLTGVKASAITEIN